MSTRSLRSRIPAVLGIVIGITGAMLAMGITAHRTAGAHGPMLAEHGGTIRSVVMQYTAGSNFVWPTYRDFLNHQSADLTVYLACPAKADFDELQAGIGAVPCKLVPIYTGHAMTTWSRDRWIELLPPSAHEPITLLASRGESQQDQWPQRAGDSRMADDLARFLQPGVAARRSNLYFDGGDLLCDGPYVFVTRAVVQRNVQHTIASSDELIEVLQRELHRKPVLMNDAPDHHAGMYMMAVGNHRMLVGDPSLGLPLVNHLPADMEGGVDRSVQTQHAFDSVARLAGDLGYNVQRIPTVVGTNGKQYLTYVNTIMDIRDGRPVVYMPTYAGQDQLNAAARTVWESLGYTVIPIDCTTTWFRGGTLHCLVNVLDRSPN